MKIALITNDDELSSYQGVGLPDGVRLLYRTGLTPESSEEEFAQILTDLHADVVVIGPDVDPTRTLQIGRVIGRSHPEVDVVAYRQADTSFLAEAMRARIRDVPEPSENHETLTVSLRSLHEAAAVRRDQILADQTTDELKGVTTVFGPKGGVGKSTLAVNLACALAAEAGNEVLLIDYDLLAGDIADLVQIESDFTVSRAIDSGAPFDAANLKLSLASLPNGPLVLPAPASLVEAEQLTTDDLSQFLTEVVDVFRYVVVDTGPGSTDATIAALAATKDLIITTTADVGAVRTLGRHLSAVESLGLLPPSRHLVLNQYDRRAGIATADIETALGQPIDITVPIDRQVQSAGNDGVPYITTKGRGPIVSAITELAGLIAEGAEEAEPAKAKGWFK